MFGFQKKDPAATSEQNAWDKSFNKLKSVSAVTYSIWFAVLYGPLFLFLSSITYKTVSMKDSTDSLFKIGVMSQVRTEMLLMIALALITIAAAVPILATVADAKKNLGSRPAS